MAGRSSIRRGSILIYRHIMMNKFRFHCVSFCPGELKGAWGETFIGIGKSRGDLIARKIHC